MKQMNLRLSEEQFNKVKELAYRKRVSVNAYMQSLIESVQMDTMPAGVKGYVPNKVKAALAPYTENKDAYSKARYPSDGDEDVDLGDSALDRLLDSD